MSVPRFRVIFRFPLSFLVVFDMYPGRARAAAWAEGVRLLRASTG